jgi:hypothetical protein
VTRPLRVLITNVKLETRTGTELYVRDLALALLRRGHAVCAFSPVLGGLAEELRRATVPVVDDLDRLEAVPDVIHAHHHLPAAIALLRFPGVPAVYVFHDGLSRHDVPPRLPRIRRFIAVDDNCRDRLSLEHGVPEDRLRVVLNWVDLERFRPRGPLPERPRRALVFSNYAADDNYLPAVRQACARAGIALDVAGAGAGASRARPEEVLGGYDLVFAKARCALEALATGSAVVLCDAGGAGPLVTADDLDRLRRLNFGLRTLSNPVRPEVLEREIRRYDARDAAEVSRRVRASAGLDAAVDELVETYREVIAEQASAGPPDLAAELRAAATYLRRIAPTLQEVDEAREFRTSVLWRLRARLRRLPAAMRLFRWLAGSR